MNYYNEIDPKAAAWLRALIERGLIAPGFVDERSITDVQPDDLVGFTQCHFFAGIGGWSYALRLAGWSDNKPVWTGSCPCQPFSSAGKQRGTDDERHLWPEFARLIGHAKPEYVFGEQVASAAGRDWLSSVRLDLEGMGYAVGAADLCAAGVGAPHIRQRLWWGGCAGWATASSRDWKDTAGASTTGINPDGTERTRLDQLPRQVALVGWMADAERTRPAPGLPATTRGYEGQSEVAGDCGGKHTGRIKGESINDTLENERMADSDDYGCSVSSATRLHERWDRAQGERSSQGDTYRTLGDDDARCFSSMRTSAYNQPWRDADWLFGRDGQWRPVESGTFPLGHGLPARVVRLRGYGNAIVPQVAQAFIEAFLDAVGDTQDLPNTPD